VLVLVLTGREKTLRVWLRLLVSVAALFGFAIILTAK